MSGMKEAREQLLNDLRDKFEMEMDAVDNLPDWRLGVCFVLLPPIKGGDSECCISRS